MMWKLRPDSYALTNRGLDSRLPDIRGLVRFMMDTHTGDLELHRAVAGGWHVLASVPTGSSMIVRETGSLVHAVEVGVPLDGLFETRIVEADDSSLAEWVRVHGGFSEWDGDGLLVHSDFDRFGFHASPGSLVVSAAGRFGKVPSAFVDDFFEVPKPLDSVPME